jgi:hypothetical protein
MKPICVDEIDLAALAEALRVRLGASLETSYLRGKTLLRDGVAAQLGCSDVEAEELVETLEVHGYVRFPQLDDETHPAERRAWEIGRATV